MSTAVITGASKGIGQAAAALFLDAGERVINLSRTASSLPQVENCLLDLCAEDTVASVKQFAARELSPGRIFLIHNAARLTSETVQNASVDDFKSVVNINVIAPQILNQALLPLMAPGSAIIYIGSTLSEKAVPGAYSYVVTKHAVVGMMRATCQDLAGTEIHTACICPGFTDTEMLRAHVGNDEKILDSIARASTFGRLIKPQEIASSIFFAANNPVTNGAVIHVNLGQIEQ